MKKTTDEVIALLLSGKHPKAKTYAGKHVMVIEDKIWPLKKGKTGIAQLKKMEAKYGKPSTLVYIPQPGVTYILING